MAQTLVVAPALQGRALELYGHVVVDSRLTDDQAWYLVNADMDTTRRAIERSVQTTGTFPALTRRPQPPRKGGKKGK